MNKTLSPIRGDYAVRNPFLNSCFRAMDGLLRLVIGCWHDADPIPPPRKILVSNVAHLGDVVMATSILPVLKSAFPDAEIGFLVGSWSQVVVQGHPMVNRVHVFDHIMHNRSTKPLCQKVWQHWQTRRKALVEIRRIKYDIAIDLYWNVGNTLPFLWRARLPVRVGYSSGGFGPLATHPLVFKDTRNHVSARYLALLRMLGISNADAAKQHPTMPPVREDARKTLRQMLQASGVVASKYIIFHTGATARFKEWPSQHWRDLTGSFIDQGYSVLFTGLGQRQKEQIEKIISGLPACVNLCDRLSWDVFVALIQGARLLVSVDTVAPHVASALNIPCVGIMPGIWPYLWRPFGNQAIVLSLPLFCSPCHRNYGCAAMDCINGVSADQVYEAAMSLLKQAGVT